MQFDTPSLADVVEAWDHARPTNGLEIARQWPAEPMDIPQHLLRVDGSYQRPLDRALVRRIVNEFDKRYFGRLVVVKTDDGAFMVVDGQHRLMAIRAMGWHDALLPCDVHIGLPLMAQAALFRRPQSRDNRKALKPEDMFRAALIEGDERAIAIKAVATEQGFVLELEHRGRVARGIGAINALDRIHREGGDDGLRAVLALVADGFGDNPDGTKSTLLQGLWRFHRKFRSIYSRKILVETLRKTTAPGMVSDGRKLAEVLHLSSPDGVARAIHARYNKGRTRNALPEWVDYREGQGRRGLDRAAEAEG